MEVFRLAREKYKDVLSGKGAAIKGARWNSAGVEIIYTAANKSLAMAEVAVSLSMKTLPADFYMLTIYVPDATSVLKLNTTDLPVDWNKFPHPLSTKKIGDDFIKQGKFCLLQIPSVVTPGDYNFLINPNHPEFSLIKIIAEYPFGFDNRLFPLV